MLTYRIELTGNQFVVIDSLDELVGKYDTEAEANKSIAECEKEDAMYETREAAHRVCDQSAHGAIQC